MAPSNAARQRQHRRPVRGSVVQIDRELPVEAAATRRYLAHPWGGTRRAAFARRWLAAWEREGRPMPGDDDDGHPLPGHSRRPRAPRYSPRQTAARSVLFGPIILGDHGRQATSQIVPDRTCMGMIRPQVGLYR